MSDGRQFLPGYSGPTAPIRRLWPFYAKSTIELVSTAISEGRVYATGTSRDIESLESAFASLHCPGGYAVFCASGTAGLHSSYFSLGLGPGAEVLVPANTFRATVTPLLPLNLCPVFCDCEENTECIDLDDAASKITSRTAAIAVTHVAGQPANMGKARALADQYGLALIEDCSHAHGTSWRGMPVGSFGDVAVFSLGTKKLISGGMGGMVITKKRDLYERIMLHSQPTPRSKKTVRDEYLGRFVATGLGANFRGNPLAAILAQEHVNRLDVTIQTKNANLRALSNLLREHLPEIRIPTFTPEHTGGTWYSFRCVWDESCGSSRDEAIQALRRVGIRVSPPDSPLHDQYGFSDLSLFSTLSPRGGETRPPQSCPRAERLTNQLLCWDTREFYEPADELLAWYDGALAKAREELARTA